MKFKSSLNFTDKHLLKWSLRGIDPSLLNADFKEKEHEIDWDSFVDHAQKSHLASYFLENAKRAAIAVPEKVSSALERYQQRIFAHHLFCLEILLALNQNLNESKIEHVFLKGWDLVIRGYSDLKVRQISDIDVLIQLKDLNGIMKVLKEMGASVRTVDFKSKLHEKIELYHAPLQASYKGISIDIHVRLFSSLTPYSFETEDLLLNKERHDFQGRSIYLLSEIDAALFCYLHAHKHLFYGAALKVAMINDFSYFKPADLDRHASLNQANQALKEMLEFEREITENHDKIGFIAFTFERFLCFRKMTFLEALILSQRRFVNLSIRWKSFGLIFYDIFPQRSFLTNNFGSSSYFICWLRRSFNFFNLFFKTKK